ncbi:MAG: YhjD/YihY/BrkB family envelope integrity protein [Nitrospirota bacterium]
MIDFFKKIRLVIVETYFSFVKNNDLTAAASLAFSAILALIPVLFLLTFILSAAIGSSEQALARTQDLLLQLIPAYSPEIIQEVQVISTHLKTIGIVNLLVLLWSITPLAADMRISLGIAFQKKPSRPFLLEKLFDVLISLLFLMGLSAIAVAGIIFTILENKSLMLVPLGYFERVIPFIFITAIVFLLYFAFSGKARIRHLIFGALITSVLWFIMTPAFHMFLTYNPGYGFAFGSFKSLFVIIIWIYYSLMVFLIGAEFAATLGREQTVLIRNLMIGSKNIPAEAVRKYVVSFTKGSVIFNEGDPGDVMYRVYQGSVELRKGDTLLSTIQEGKCFGAISFLLSLPRRAVAIAREDVSLVVIKNENITPLINQYPEVIIEMLKEIALRFREENKTVD